MTATDMPSLPQRLSAKNEGSFAYCTVRDRLPVILTKVVNTVYTYRIKAAEQHGEEGAADCKTIVSILAKLRNELQTNKSVLPLVSSDADDAQIWQRYLEEETARNAGTPPSWFQSPWLYVECYMYRRIVEAIRQSKCLKDFDPFRDQKETALLQSQDALQILAGHLERTLEERRKDFRTFAEFVQISLWGNKCDLSISAGVENSQKVSPLAQLGPLRDNILVDDTENLWQVLRERSEGERKSRPVRLDIVLDNAGFELFTDLCLAEFALRAGLADRVVFHHKAMPWFVSDVGLGDFMHTLGFLESHESKVLSGLGQSWARRLDVGSWSLQGHPFWTTPHDFSEMGLAAPDLYRELARSDLILLKGDLNYRKLVGDRDWEPTVPYPAAVGGFRPAPSCALRTCKADVVAGLGEGVAERVSAKDAEWLVDGKYAVIQFCDILRT